MIKIEMRFGPHAMLTIEITDQMAADWRRCKEEAGKVDSHHPCDGCALNNDVIGHGICEFTPVIAELNRQIGGQPHEEN